LAKALLANKSLKTVHASNNKFQSEAAKAMALVVEKTTHLKDLDLSNNLIIMEELQILANAFKESQLDCLNLRHNLISAEEVIAFDSVLSMVSNQPKRKFLF
jgi:Ran GTPase-activating protein (RanGAP) involved in mRNA processing and transport